MKFRIPKQFVSILLIVAFSITVGASQAKADNAPGVAYRTVNIENIDIFYREAGDPSKPTDYGTGRRLPPGSTGLPGLRIQFHASG